MTGNPALFSSFTPHNSSPPISLADGSHAPVVVLALRKEPEWAQGAARGRRITSGGHNDANDTKMGNNFSAESSLSSLSLFPIDPKIFWCTYFVRDVCPHLTKLDPKSLKCIFLGYSHVQKGYRCYSLDLNKYVVSTDVIFSEHTPFSSCDPTPRQGEPDDDFLIYMYPPDPTPPAPTSHVQPPITQTYSRRLHP
ncbi:hypothetical protein C2S51_019965 [Perilla frutescens var. frutescens]|nr:hypothetical protein C2S51_019965 [Perilla frutescens var. frutescens]